MKTIYIKVSAIITIISITTVNLYAQNNLQRIDSLVNDLYKNTELSGNILVASKGQVVYKSSHGYADVAGKILNSDSSAFQLASVSKTFTAVAILQLKEKGRLKLDDAVIKYLSDFPFNNITIRHLLSHTSGLTDFQVFEGPHRTDTNKIFSNADIIPAIKNDKQAMLFKPGEKWSYSNIGFGLLAMIVEKISGMPFQNYLAKYIFKLANMNHTYITTPLLVIADKNRTKNYDFLSYEPSRLKRVDSMPKYKIPYIILRGTMGNGNIISTTEDMLRFDQTLYSSKLLKPSTLKEAFTPTKLNDGKYALWGRKNTSAYYGLGWMILCDSTHGKIVFHSGGMPGAVTVFLRNITNNQTVIVLDNVLHRGVIATGVNIMYLLNEERIHPDKISIAKIYAIALFEKGPDYAAMRFNELKTDTAHYFMNEDELNELALHMLFDGHHTEALEGLKLNTILYPDSWNVYDSYAEALAMVGKKEEAIVMYKKSIKMNPDNGGGKNALKRLEAK
ncbi:MAG TPA: serine hydrolase domain-containing protein [Mucilaginibacter sp.]